jgi:hypothetical protein
MMSEYLDKLIIGSLSAAILWLFRIVFTNHKKITVLEVKLDQKIKNDDRMHLETINSIKNLTDSNNRAIDNQQKILEKLIK